MNARHRTACLLLPLVLLTQAAPARAAGSQDEAAAEVLFREAKKLATDGHYSEACPKFVESQRLGPSSGTLLNIGDCYEALDKLASAWGAFQEARLSARNSGNTGREQEAERRAGLLAPKLAKLTIVVPGTTRAVPGLVVKKDGAVVGEGQWGSALPADVGNYTIEASAPGYKPWSSIVRIGTDGSSASVWVPPPEKQPDTPDTPASPYWTGQRIAGGVVGGVGLVGVVVGSVFGVQTFNKNSASMAYCPNTPTVCYASAVPLRNDAYSAATASTIAFIAGGAGVAAGAITFFTATKGASKSVAIVASPGSLALQGVW